MTWTRCFYALVTYDNLYQGYSQTVINIAKKKKKNLHRQDYDLWYILSVLIIDSDLYCIKPPHRQDYGSDTNTGTLMCGVKLNLYMLRCMDTICDGEHFMT